MEINGPAGADQRLRRIEAVTDTTLAHLGLQDLLVELLDRARELLDVDTAAALLLDAAAGELVATAARGLEEEVSQGWRVPVGQGFAGRVAAERQPVRIDRVDHTNVLNPILREKNIKSLLGLPMLAGGSLIGVLHVGSLHPRSFTDEETELLQLVADRAALVTEARQSSIERDAILALQRSLLPAGLLDHPTFELAARYVPGAEAGVGGDWYDVFSLPWGGVGVVMGDVVGQGLQAAVVMGRLRSALRAYALESADPATVLTQLDRMALHFEDTMATTLYAVFEPSGERFRISSAGHPAPVMAGYGSAAVLDLPVDVPLGTFAGQHRRARTVDLPTDALLLFYTDGLVERRWRPIDAGLQRLGESVVAGPAEAACSMAMGRMVGNEAPPDDIAMLALRRRRGQR